MEKALKQIFERNFGYLARWNTTNANHVSMAAAAMYLMREKTQVRMEKLIDDSQTNSKQLSPRRKNDTFVKLIDLPWNIQQTMLGYDDLQESWYSFFQSEFEGDLVQTIPVWLERLGIGFSSAAGHSVIRIYYAIAVRKVLTPSIFKEELAISFADIASRHYPMTEGTIAIGSNALEDYLEYHLPIDNAVSALVNSGTLIEDRMMILRATSYYQDTVSNIAINFNIEKCLRRLAGMVKKSPDFMLLHTITTGQALLELIRWYPDMDDSSLRQGYRDFVVAAVISSHLPNSMLIFETNLKVREIFERVPLLKNDHSQKATYSLMKLHEEYRHPEFLNAAKYYQDAYK